MRKTLIAVALATGVSSLFAQQPPPSDVPLSLRAALEQARAYEARYQASRAAFRADSEILEQTRAGLLPEVSVSANRTYNDLTAVAGSRAQTMDYVSGGSSITLRQPIYRPENWARYQQAKSEVGRLEAVLSADTNRLMVEVTGAYLEVLRSLAEYRSFQGQQKSLQAQAAGAARGVPLGLASASERDERQARAELAGLRAIQAEAKLAEARRQLEKMVGQRVSQLMSPQDNGLDAASFSVDDLTVWLDKAGTRSPEVRAARAAVEVARDGIDRAKAGHKPTLDLVAGRSKSVSETFTAINNTFYNSSIGVQLSVPLYAGGRHDSAVRQAVANHEKAQAQLEQAQRETGVLVEREHMTVRQAAQRLRAHDAMVRSAQQNLVAARQGQERGTRSLLDVLEAQGLLDSAMFEQAGARLELVAAKLRLQALVDEVDERAITQLGGLLVQPVSVER